MPGVSFDDLKCLGHSPEHGYFAWMFKYKNTYVVFYDESNSQYNFGGQVNDISKFFLPDRSESPYMSIEKGENK